MVQLMSNLRTNRVRQHTIEAAEKRQARSKTISTQLVNKKR